MTKPEDLRDQMPTGDNSPEKYDYLKAKYIFRFPFTWTAMKWGIALGSFFGIHQYVKSRNFTQALRWFVLGNVGTAMPIWGFFMFKYSFYTVSIRKFEVEQSNTMEEVNLSREYMIYKLKCNPNIEQKQLVDIYQKKTDEMKDKYNLLDELLVDIDYKELDLLGEGLPEQKK